MKKLFATIGILTMIGMVVAVGVGAADEATVTATVTVQNISVSVSDGTVPYGTLGLDSTENTCDLPDTQTATNDGNVTEDFNIRGQNSTDGWTLAATAGSDQYVHNFFASSDSCGDGTGTALTTSSTELTSGVAVDGTYDFDLEVNTPTSTSSYDEQSIDVTVQAVASS